MMSDFAFARLFAAACLCLVLSGLLTLPKPALAQQNETDTLPSFELQPFRSFPRSIFIEEDNAAGGLPSPEVLIQRRARSEIWVERSDSPPVSRRRIPEVPTDEPDLPFIERPDYLDRYFKEWNHRVAEWDEETFGGIDQFAPSALRSINAPLDYYRARIDQATAVLRELWEVRSGVVRERYHYDHPVYWVVTEQETFRDNVRVRQILNRFDRLGRRVAEETYTLEERSVAERIRQWQRRREAFNDRKLRWAAAARLAGPLQTLQNDLVASAVTILASEPSTLNAAQRLRLGQIRDQLTPTMEIYRVHHHQLQRRVSGQWQNWADSFCAQAAALLAVLTESSSQLPATSCADWRPANASTQSQSTFNDQMAVQRELLSDLRQTLAGSGLQSLVPEVNLPVQADSQTESAADLPATGLATAGGAARPAPTPQQNLALPLGDGLLRDVSQLPPHWAKAATMLAMRRLLDDLDAIDDLLIPEAAQALSPTESWQQWFEARFALTEALQGLAPFMDNLGSLLPADGEGLAAVTSQWSAAVSAAGDWWTASDTLMVEVPPLLARLDSLRLWRLRLSAYRERLPTPDFSASSDIQKARQDHLTLMAQLSAFENLLLSYLANWQAMGQASIETLARTDDVVTDRLLNLEHHLLLGRVDVADSQTLAIKQWVGSLISQLNRVVDTDAPAEGPWLQARGLVTSLEETLPQVIPVWQDLGASAAVVIDQANQLMAGWRADRNTARLETYRVWRYLETGGASAERRTYYRDSDGTFQLIIHRYSGVEKLQVEYRAHAILATLREDAPEIEALRSRYESAELPCERPSTVADIDPRWVGVRSRRQAYITPPRRQGNQVVHPAAAGIPDVPNVRRERTVQAICDGLLWALEERTYDERGFGHQLTEELKNAYRSTVRRWSRLQEQIVYRAPDGQRIDWHTFERLFPRLPVADPRLAEFAAQRLPGIVWSLDESQSPDNVQDPVDEASETDSSTETEQNGDPSANTSAVSPEDPATDELGAASLGNLSEGLQLSTPNED